MEQVELVFRPNKKQALNLHRHPFWKYSIEGELRDGNGRRTGTVCAKTVVSPKGVRMSFPGPEVEDYFLIGRPDDLTVTYVKAEERRSDSKPVQGSFWISPHQQLTPFVSVFPEFDGSATSDEVGIFELELSAKYKVQFKNRFRDYSNELGERVTFRELVASFQALDPEANFDSIPDAYSDLDDVLLLASFAGRQPCVSLGWDAVDGNDRIEHFVNNRTRPDQDVLRRSHDWLIDPGYFEEFMRKAYETLKITGPHDSIRRALRFAAPFEAVSVATHITNLFTGVEVLVSYFRKLTKLNHVFAEDQPDQVLIWKNLKTAIKKTIDSPDSQASDEQRRLVKEKLNELNRISFGKAFSECCKAWQVDLSDLWPLTDRKFGVPIIDIRNRLVHGEVADSKYLMSFTYARMHLQWTLERMLLGLLGWEVSKSVISSVGLSRHVPYCEWKDERISIANWC